MTALSVKLKYKKKFKKWNYNFLINKFLKKSLNNYIYLRKNALCLKAFLFW